MKEGEIESWPLGTSVAAGIDGSRGFRVLLGWVIAARVLRLKLGRAGRSGDRGCRERQCPVGLNPSRLQGAAKLGPTRMRNLQMHL